MSRLLVVHADSVHAHLLRDALRVYIDDEIVFTENATEALEAMDTRLPDVVLIPTLTAAVEDHVVAYLSTLPGSGHVQVLGLPPLARSGDAVPQRQIVLPWRRRHEWHPVVPRPCDPDLFARDVIAYLARAKALKDSIAVDAAHAAGRHRVERRREPRFPAHEATWISGVHLGPERATVVDVSSRGALLRVRSRPEYRYLRRSAPGLPGRPYLTVVLETSREVQAGGRIIRCVPSTGGSQPQYEVAFAFDEAIGLHLPAPVSTASSADDDESIVSLTLTR